MRITLLKRLRREAADVFTAIEMHGGDGVQIKLPHGCYFNTEVVNNGIELADFIIDIRRQYILLRVEQIRSRRHIDRHIDTLKRLISCPHKY